MLDVCDVCPMSADEAGSDVELASQHYDEDGHLINQEEEEDEGEGEVEYKSATQEEQEEAAAEEVDGAPLGEASQATTAGDSAAASAAPIAASCCFIEFETKFPRVTLLYGTRPALRCTLPGESGALRPCSHCSRHFHHSCYAQSVLRMTGEVVADDWECNVCLQCAPKPPTQPAGENEKQNTLPEGEEDRSWAE